MGQFSIRGGIIDIFPLTEELPVQIDLRESTRWTPSGPLIRRAERSIAQMDSVLIYPAAELTLTKEQIGKRHRPDRKGREKAGKGLPGGRKARGGPPDQDCRGGAVRGLKGGL